MRTGTETYSAQHASAARKMLLGLLGALVIAFACLLPLTLAWSSLGQHALNEFEGGRSAEPLRVTMTVQNRDGSVLSDEQAAKEFTFSVQLVKQGGSTFDSELSYTIYEQAEPSPDRAYAATDKVDWDFEHGVAVETGTFSGQRDFKLVHGQWLQTDRMPRGTVYHVQQTKERSYAHTATEPDGAIVEGGNQVDLLNIYAPTGISVTKAVMNADGSALSTVQMDQEFTFEVNFTFDGLPVQPPHGYEIYETDGTPASQMVQHEDGFVVDSLQQVDDNDNKVNGSTEEKETIAQSSTDHSAAHAIESADETTHGALPVDKGTSLSADRTDEDTQAQDRITNASEASSITSISSSSSSNEMEEGSSYFASAASSEFSTFTRADTRDTSPDSIIIHIKQGQYAEFVGLEPGTEFTVREVDVPDAYVALATQQRGTVRDGAMTTVSFTNGFGFDASSPVGSLLVRETVHRLAGNLTSYDKEALFAFEISFFDAGGNSLTADTMFSYGLFRQVGVHADLVPEVDAEGVPIRGQLSAQGGTIYLRHDQAALFEDLPPGILWSITEHPTDGYEQWIYQIEGEVFPGALSHAPFDDEALERHLTIEGTKTWDLSAATKEALTVPGKYVADIAHGLNTAASDVMPESITVRLVPKDGTLPAYEQTVYPNERGEWVYVFQVPLFDTQGREIDYSDEYRLEEDPIEGFTSSIMGFNVLNTYVAKEPNPPVDPDDPQPTEPDNPDSPQNPSDSSSSSAIHPGVSLGDTSQDDGNQALAKTNDEALTAVPLLALIVCFATLLALISLRMLRREE